MLFLNIFSQVSGFLKTLVYKTLEVRKSCVREVRKVDLSVSFCLILCIFYNSSPNILLGIQWWRPFFSHGRLNSVQVCLCFFASVFIEKFVLLVEIIMNAFIFIFPKLYLYFLFIILFVSKYEQVY